MWKLTTDSILDFNIKNIIFLFSALKSVKWFVSRSPVLYLLSSHLTFLTHLTGRGGGPILDIWKLGSFYVAFWSVGQTKDESNLNIRARERRLILLHFPALWSTIATLLNSQTILANSSVKSLKYDRKNTTAILQDQILSWDLGWWEQNWRLEGGGGGWRRLLLPTEEGVGGFTTPPSPSHCQTWVNK